jgi:hypothetical protein
MPEVTNINPNPTVPVDNNTPPATTTTEQPLILGKFKTQADLEKAYSELEKKQSKPKTLVDPIPDAPTVPVMPDVDFDAIGQEFADSGELSEDSYNKSVDWIKKTNPKMDDAKAKKVLDQYMAGLNAQQAVQQQEVDKMLDDTIGGRDNYTAMVQWASVNMTPEEIEAYDSAIASNINSAKLAIEGLYAKYTKVNGNPPAKLLSGDGSKVSSSVPNKFDNWDEYLEKRHDPKYNSDPSYRNSVKEALRRSDLK